MNNGSEASTVSVEYGDHAMTNNDPDNTPFKTEHLDHIMANSGSEAYTDARTLNSFAFQDQNVLSSITGDPATATTKASEPVIYSQHSFSMPLAFRPAPMAEGTGQTTVSSEFSESVAVGVGQDMSANPTSDTQASDGWAMEFNDWLSSSGVQL